MVFWKRHRLLICGFYGHHNLGDEAMLVGMLCLLKRCLGPDYLHRVTVYSNDPDDTAKQHGVATLRNQFPRRRREQWIKWAEHTLALWQHDFFILGGGDLLRDSPDREVATVWLGPLQRAMALGCQTIVLGISVGEVWKTQTQEAIVKTLNQVTLIAVRDQQSQKQLQQMGVIRPIHVISDLALQITSTQSLSRSQIALSQSASNGSALNIGISIRSLVGRSSELDADVEQSFYREMAKIIDYLIGTQGATVSLLPFQTHTPSDRAQRRPQDNDEDAIATVLEQCQQRQNINVYEAFDSVEQAINTLQSFDLVIGTRLHSLILAAGLGIPILAAVYDKKVSGFMTEIDQQLNSIAVQQFTLERVKPRLEKLLTHQPENRLKLVKAVEDYRQTMEPVADKLCQLLGS
ncbi:hypothetical protein D0962_15725 [Leptolyngbyaceae cyanobacterium CCMR0082]|uniref:Polysaccharide pyruvyl transferase domain-containing protein n=1 Tax=Adonisia turfae CCMR0082 TaxID=2304604 RepID=A0A6M0S8U8_9CYAN|nr:polysaccharide pyruvyl transferase family protein [Adonisia turfae]NEZ64222.1 hypothetical protein [Adonisia turfae CCMR0082]